MQWLSTIADVWLGLVASAPLAAGADLTQAPDPAREAMSAAYEKLRTGDAAGGRELMARAHALFVHSTGESWAGSDEWHARLGAAFALDDYPDCALVITTIAKRWPETLTSIRDEAILQVSAALEKVGAERASRLGMLDALFTANWKLESGNEPSQAWSDFARMLLEDNQPQRAAVVALRAGEGAR